VHVVLRVTGEVGRLRRRSAYQAVRWAMIKAAGRTNFRIVHLSIQGEHIHLLCEADDRIALANGIRGFCVSATITHPRQARNALAYVLNNWRKHRDDRGAMRTAQVDRYSTGVWFPSWAERDGVPFVWPKGYEPLPCRAPTTWLLKEGWKRGRAVVSLKEVPGGSEQMLQTA